jgi:hypothetical protein
VDWAMLALLTNKPNATKHKDLKISVISNGSNDESLLILMKALSRQLGVFH